MTSDLLFMMFLTGCCYLLEVYLFIFSSSYSRLTCEYINRQLLSIDIQYIIINYWSSSIVTLALNRLVFCLRSQRTLKNHADSCLLLFLLPDCQLLRLSFLHFARLQDRNNVGLDAELAGYRSLRNRFCTFRSRFVYCNGRKASNYSLGFQELEAKDDCGLNHLRGAKPDFDWRPSQPGNCYRTSPYRNLAHGCDYELHLWSGFVESWLDAISSVSMIYWQVNRFPLMNRCVYFLGKVILLGLESVAFPATRDSQNA